MRKQKEPNKTSETFLRTLCEEKGLTLEITDVIKIKGKTLTILTGEILNNDIEESCRQLTTLIFTKYRKTNGTKTGEGTRLLPSRNEGE